MTLSQYDLADTEPYELEPGMSHEVIVTSTVTTDTTNEATWSAYVDDTIVAKDSDTATVMIIIPEPEGYWIYLPVVMKDFSP